MSDLTSLEALIVQLAKNQTLPRLGEAATRQAAINPVLRALGWNPENLDEVVPEFPVPGGGKADYCLRNAGLSRVLIEVKSAGTQLEAHQDQLLGYAIAGGAPIAVLTDGLNWWFYLAMSSMAAGKSWQDRRFLHVDFRERDASGAAADLDRFLDRDASVAGAAFKAAEEEFARQERDRSARAVLPEAWGRALGDPRLHELLAKKVEDVLGHPPEPETITGFLRTISGGVGVAATRPAPLQPPISASAETTTGQKAAATRQKRIEDLLSPKTHDWEYVRVGHAPDGVQSVTGARLKAYHVLRDRRTGDEVVVGRGEMIKYAGVEPSVGHPEPTGNAGRRRRTPSVPPAAFELDDALHEVTSWRRLLPTLCEQLARRAGPAFAGRVAEVRGRTRPYFSASGAELRMPLEIPGTGLHVEGNLSADQAERVARLTLHAVRGSDEGFRIILAGELAPPSEGAYPGGRTAVAPPTADFKGRSPAAFRLDGERLEAARWNEVLRGTCEQLAHDLGPAFAGQVAHLQGKRRPYFSSTPSDLRVPLRIPAADLYVEGNFSANDCVRLARRVVAAVRGSDAGFEIELAE